MKKFCGIVLCLAVLWTAAVFAGGQNDGDGGKPIELVYWSHYGQSPQFVQAFADASNAALKKIGYDNVTCRAEVIEYSGYETKYLTAFASGKGPDMFLARASDYALEGGANPIALPFPADLEKTWTDALAGAYKDDGMFGGKRYGFPSEGGSVQMLYINTDYMKEAGLNPETDYPKTVDEFIEAAQKMTKYDGRNAIVRSGYHPRFLGGGEGVSGKFIPLIHQFGGRVLSEDLKTAKGYINGPGSAAAFQFYQDLVTKYRVVNLEFGAPETAFQSGQTAMIFREGWFAQDIIDKAPNINFIVVPYISGTKNLASHGGGAPWSNMINAKSKHVDICVALFKELAKPEYDIMLHEPAGYPPVLGATMTMDNPYFGKLPYAEAMIGSLSKAPAPIYDVSPKYSSVAYMVGDSVAAVVNGANVKTELDKLADKMQVVLDQN
ncbi:ABC transporter substrate-binding protein [Breznakiella homolactica]|uniref:Extracellular solute-binding protein n=1 Tax=Breznakiella homolactica TaxID=2798577 RepID=A0A7T7XR60_9SPIR|nr:extracellular solute-binding protein [Breznakiella homolactica]QQO10981.1 extracellular solute-binding protein [Breznakiella homolactica]